jgi:act minimal PKS acyl carrier protein
MSEIGLTELFDLLNDCNGDADPVEPSADLIDTTFDALGFDSLTLLNAVGRLERSHGITLSDTVVSEAKTPRQLLEQVGAQLA